MVELICRVLVDAGPSVLDSVCTPTKVYARVVPGHDLETTYAGTDLVETFRTCDDQLKDAMGGCSRYL
ncbi:MAG: hypothetical protein AB1733_16670 [Thermodesulfobacteriota bacterium]